MLLCMCYKCRCMHVHACTYNCNRLHLIYIYMHLVLYKVKKCLSVCLSALFGWSDSQPWVDVRLARHVSYVSCKVFLSCKINCDLLENLLQDFYMLLARLCRNITSIWLTVLPKFSSLSLTIPCGHTNLICMKLYCQ